MHKFIQNFLNQITDFRVISDCKLMGIQQEMVNLWKNHDFVVLDFMISINVSFAKILQYTSYILHMLAAQVCLHVVRQNILIIYLSRVWAKKHTTGSQNQN